MILAARNGKASPNIQEVKRFLNLWLFATSLILNQLLYSCSVVPDTSIEALAQSSGAFL